MFPCVMWKRLSFDHNSYCQALFHMVIGFPLVYFYGFILVQYKLCTPSKYNYVIYDHYDCYSIIEIQLHDLIIFMAATILLTTPEIFIFNFLTIYVLRVKVYKSLRIKSHNRIWSFINF